MTDHPPADTTVDIERARNGDLGSLGRIVDRLSPFLVRYARLRLDSLHASASLDPFDIVQEAWLVLMERFGTLEPKGERLTPVVMSFLMGIIRKKALELRRRHITQSLATKDDATNEDDLRAEQTGVITRACRREAENQVEEALSVLSEEEMGVLLRRLEGMSHKEIGSVSGESEATIAQRYHRTVKKLRTGLETQLLDDLLPHD